MSHIGTQCKRALTFVHRWMGVALCLLFLLWFASGMAMMYWEYPTVSSADRWSRSPALDASRIKLSPEQAYARTQWTLSPDRVRLAMFDGRPAYRFGAGRAETMVYADDGQAQTEFPPEMTLRIAASWTGESPGAAKVEENTKEDQWTVSGEFRKFRPMRKYSWPDGEQVYVSTVTGDVVQYTTRASRWGAYLGPIPHWLYFTPLRKHAQQWSRLVIWVSGLGSVAAILGIVVGLWTYSPSKPFRYAGAPSSLPYSGQKRWHSILGLIFGLLAFSWAFSGMLSMDPFPQLQGETSGDIGDRLAGALRGTSFQLADFSAKLPQEALVQADSALGDPQFQVKELELTSSVGEPVYLLTAGLNKTRIVPLRGQPSAEFDWNKIMDAVKQAAQPYALAEVRLVTEYEPYYVDRHKRRPLPVIFVQLNDRDRSAYYINPKTAEIVQGYNANARWNRWLYHGLHSFDLPWLYTHRPVWDVVMLIPLLGGTSLCVTALILAVGVLRRRFVTRRVEHNANDGPY